MPKTRKTKRSPVVMTAQNMRDRLDKLKSQAGRARWWTSTLPEARTLEATMKAAERVRSAERLGAIEPSEARKRLEALRLQHHLRDLAPQRDSNPSDDNGFESQQDPRAGAVTQRMLAPRIERAIQAGTKRMIALQEAMDNLAEDDEDSRIDMRAEMRATAARLEKAYAAKSYLDNGNRKRAIGVMVDLSRHANAPKARAFPVKMPLSDTPASAERRKYVLSELPTNVVDANAHTEWPLPSYLVTHQHHPLTVVSDNYAIVPAEIRQGPRSSFASSIPDKHLYWGFVVFSFTSGLRVFCDPSWGVFGCWAIDPIENESQAFEWAVTAINHHKLNFDPWPGPLAQ